MPARCGAANVFMGDRFGLEPALQAKDFISLAQNGRFFVEA